jgi:lipopolysaccharide transport system permease protein
MNFSKYKAVYTPFPDTMLQYVSKIWNFRSLISVFAIRDLKVKYAQTILGLGWTIIQPLAGLLIFTFFFGYILGWKANDLPFSLYVYSGLLGWNFFSYIVYQGVGSVHESGHIIKKIYYPKFIMPLSKVLVGMVELVVSFIVIFPLMIYYGKSFSWKIILLPIPVFFNVIMALAIVMWVSAFAYKKRDLLHLVPFLMYFGIWLTPVFFTFEILPENMRFLWFFNPMAGVVEAWRWTIFADWNFNLYYLPAMLLMIPFFLVGMKIYSKKEFEFSDYV